MSIYKDLDIIISDYVGYREEGYDYDFTNYECADIDLYNSIVDECSRHLNGEMKLEYMSKDAQICIKNWEELIQSYSLAQMKGA